MRPETEFCTATSDQILRLMAICACDADHTWLEQKGDVDGGISFLMQPRQAGSRDSCPFELYSR